VPDCRRNPNYAVECRTQVPAASFMSGHTALAFAAALMSCVHHTELELYGSRAADVAACATPLALASVVGLLRVMADQHYASDVVAGAVLGSASTLGLGLFLHY
jgi:membrane-associated phospholipid phosphatase